MIAKSSEPADWTAADSGGSGPSDPAAEPAHPPGSSQGSARRVWCGCRDTGQHDPFEAVGLPAHRLADRSVEAPGPETRRRSEREPVRTQTGRLDWPYTDPRPQPTLGRAEGRPPAGERRSTVKPLYVVGTNRDVGKTMFCIGLISILQDRGLRVGYTKPIGQRVRSIFGQPVHDDTLVVARATHLEEANSPSTAVPLTRGRVEKEIHTLRTEELAAKIKEGLQPVRAANDLVLVEGMGHVAMGSCIGLSSAHVAQLLDAKLLLIARGGIGSTIDEIALCQTFLKAHGADLIGVVVNKVWRQKYDRVKDAAAKGLAQLGIRCFGMLPYEDLLAKPRVGQVTEELGAEVLCGAESMQNRIGDIIVGAMEADHMITYLRDRTLVITPSDRTDNVLAVVTRHKLARPGEKPVAGIVLTGGARPGQKVMAALAASGLPTVLCSDDTYSLAAKLRETVFKITPDDPDRIETAKRLINECVAVDDILAALAQ